MDVFLKLPTGESHPFELKPDATGKDVKEVLREMGYENCTLCFDGGEVADGAEVASTGIEGGAVLDVGLSPIAQSRAVLREAGPLGKMGVAAFIENYLGSGEGEELLPHFKVVTSARWTVKMNRWESLMRGHGRPQTTQDVLVKRLETAIQWLPEGVTIMEYALLRLQPIVTPGIVIRLLVQQGCKFEQRGKWNPLEVSVNRGDVETVRVLLDHDADPHTGKSQSPLEAAAVLSNSEILGMLLDVASMANTGLIRTLIRSNKLLHHQRVLSEAVKTESDGQREKLSKIITRVLPLCCEKNDVDSLKVLTSLASGLPKTCSPAVMTAAVQDDPRKLEHLFACGVTWQRSTRSPLLAACKAGQPGTTRLLLERDCEPSAQCMRVAAASAPVLSLLLEHGGDASSALHEAIRKGSSECVELLLRSNADANVLSSDGEEPALLVASRIAEEPTVLSLLQHGATPDQAQLVECAKRKMTTVVRAALDTTHAGELDLGALLKVAVDNGVHEMAEVLVSKGAHTQGLLTHAASQGPHMMQLVRKGNEVTVEVLHTAVAAGQVGGVAGLLPCVGNVNELHKGVTALHLAVRLRNPLCMVEKLLASGASVAAVAADGTTPVTRAVRRRYHATVRLLLGRGGVVGAADLIRAVVVGDEQILSILAEQAPQEVRANTHIARAIVRSGCPRLLEAGIAAGLTFQYYTEAEGGLVNVAVRSRKWSLVRRLIECGASLRGDKCTPILQRAVRSGDVDLISLLLKAGAPPMAANRYGQLPLHTAVLRRAHSLVPCLAAAAPGALNTPDANGKVPLALAVRRWSPDMMQLLLNAGAKAGGHGLLAQFMKSSSVAPRDAVVEHVRTLIKAGAGVNERSADGTVALFHLLTKTRESLVVELINQGADVTVEVLGMTLLQWACKHSNHVEILLDHGADPNKKGPKGETPLLIALRNNNYAIQMLLAKGADASVRDAKGETAFWVCQKLSPDKMVELIKSGALMVPSVRNSGGLTPLMAVFATRGMLCVPEDIVKKHINEADNAGDTAAHYAMMRRCLLSVEYMERVGYNLAHKNNRGQTVLHLWGKHNFQLRQDLSPAAMALMKDADVYGYTPLHYLSMNTLYLPQGLLKGLPKELFEQRDAKGNTPLHLAVSKWWGYQGYEACDVEAVNADNETPLHLAMAYGRGYHVPSILVTANTLNARDNKGNTALHNAARRRVSQAVQKLLVHQPDMTIKDNEGRTPYDVASPRVSRLFDEPPAKKRCV